MKTFSFTSLSLLTLTSSAFADFTVTTWNTKHIGRRNFDIDRAALVVSHSDLIVLQEVNSTPSGTQAVTALAQTLSERLATKFCVGLSEIPTDANERYAVLWREDRLAYMTTNGQVVTSCPAFAITVRLGSANADKIVREPAVARFQEVSSGHRFWVATIHTVPTSKNPAAEIPYVFDAAMKTAPNSPWIVAGDFNLGCADPSFSSAAALGFVAVLPCHVPTSLKSMTRELNKPYDNILVKGMRTGEGKVLNLYLQFPDMAQDEVYRNLSDHSPVTAQIHLD